MSMKVNNITELVGKTPIVKFNKIIENGAATVWGKLEYFNPAGSVKDRIGLSMILDAEDKGLLNSGSTIVEPTSGNTGIALAFVAAQRGYRLILTMPETMSKERIDLLKAYGAELILVKTEDGPGMSGAIKRAEELAMKHGYFMPQQFKNLANPKIHEITTGPEIVEAFEDIGLDYFISGIGTGGTITGTGKILRENFPEIKIYAVEPKNSPVLSGGVPGKHSIQGIGAGFVPDVLDIEIFDDIIQVKDEHAISITRKIAKQEGILLGISSGATMYAALKVARGKGVDKHLLAILPDAGERYLSTDLFN